MPSDDHPLADLPTTTRIDAVLAILSAMEVQKSGGWTVADLAELCGCSQAAIVARQQAALAAARHKAAPILAALRHS